MMGMRGFLTFLAALIISLSAANAQNVPLSCDVDYYDVLRTQAEIQAQQDVESAQTFLASRQSVLQYSCFMDALTAMATNADFGDDVMGAFDDVVVKPLQDYIGDNFPNSSGPCGQMTRVWTLAQCGDLSLNSLRDMAFWAGNDMRGCTSGGREHDYTVALAVVNGRAGQSGNADIVDAYVQELETCGAPVPTGLTLSSGAPEMTCITPGCAYIGGGCSR